MNTITIYWCGFLILFTIGIVGATIFDANTETEPPAVEACPEVDPGSFEGRDCFFLRDEWWCELNNEDVQKLRSI